MDIYVPDEIDIAQESVRTPAKRKSRRGSEESASDVETVLAEPAKRNKKKPKMKVVTFDDVGRVQLEYAHCQSLEMSGEGSYAAQYVEEMLKLRTTVDHKKHDTLVQVKVNSMVDRGGLWMECRTIAALATDISPGPRHVQLCSLPLQSTGQVQVGARRCRSPSGGEV